MNNKIEMNKHVWEGWTVGAFIRELEPTFDTIMGGGSWMQPFRTEDELKRWCMENQPFYKRHIPEVFKYFRAKMKDAAK